MNLLVWNYHGLQNLCTRKELSELVRAKDSVVFIVATSADEVRLKQIKNDIQFDCLFFVPRVNREGGLAMLWKNSINFSIKSFSKNHIDSIIDKGSNEV